MKRLKETEIKENTYNYFPVCHSHYETKMKNGAA